MKEYNVYVDFASNARKTIKRQFHSIKYFLIIIVEFYIDNLKNTIHKGQKKFKREVTN